MDSVSSGFCIAKIRRAYSRFIVVLRYVQYFHARIARTALAGLVVQLFALDGTHPFGIDRRIRRYGVLRVGLHAFVGQRPQDRCKFSYLQRQLSHACAQSDGSADRSTLAALVTRQNPCSFRLLLAKAATNWAPAA